MASALPNERDDGDSGNDPGTEDEGTEDAGTDDAGTDDAGTDDAGTTAHSAEQGQADDQTGP
jgi:hypothetical protein